MAGQPPSPAIFLSVTFAVNRKIEEGPDIGAFTTKSPRRELSHNSRYLIRFFLALIFPPLIKQRLCLNCLIVQTQGEILIISR